MTEKVFCKVMKCYEEKNLIIDSITFYKFPTIFGPSRGGNRHHNLIKILDWNNDGFTLNVSIISSIGKVENVIFVKRKLIRSIIMLKNEGGYYRSRTKKLF